MGDRILSHSKTLVLLLVGLPGAGKTQISLILSSNSSIWLNEIRLLQHSSFDGDKQNLIDFKPHLSISHICFDNIYHELNGNIETCEFNVELWHHSRDVALNRMQEILAHSNYAETTPGFNLIIMDDNMNYKSMRYEVAKISAQYGSQLCYLYIRPDYEIALNRNRSRKNQVPELTISRMVIEEPGQTAYWWDKNVLEFDNSSTFDQTEIEEKLKELLPWREISSFWFANPLQPPKSNHTSSLDDINTQQSVLQSLDLRCRKVIGSILKSPENRPFGKHLSQFKQIFMNDFKKNGLTEMSSTKLDPETSVDLVLDELENEFLTKLEFVLSRLSVDSLNQ